MRLAGVTGFAGIVGLCVGGAVLYGIVHDQITARVCIEYFTVGHPKVVESRDPTVLGLVWGVIATWWFGLFLGCLVASFSTLGSRPPLGARDLVRPLAVALLAMGALAAAAGFVGAALARSGAVWLLEPTASAVPAAHHVGFLADLWAHLASYGGGLLAAVALSVWAWRRRGRLARSAAAGAAPADPLVTPSPR